MLKHLKLINYFMSEKYRCGSCEVTLTKAQVRHTWRCPDPACNQYVIIEAKDTDGETGVFIRKAADEVNAGDLMRPNTKGVHDAVKVLGVRRGSGKHSGKIVIACEASATIYAEPDYGYTFHF